NVEHPAPKMFDQHERSHSLEHRHFDVLTFSGSRLVKECRQHAIGGGEACHLIGNNGGCKTRLSCQQSINGGHAAKPLHDIVISGVISVRTVATEAIGPAVNDAWISRLYGLIIQS